MEESINIKDRLDCLEFYSDFLVSSQVDQVKILVFSFIRYDLVVQNFTAGVVPGNISQV